MHILKKYINNERTCTCIIGIFINKQFKIRKKTITFVQKNE